MRVAFPVLVMRGRDWVTEIGERALSFLCGAALAVIMLWALGLLEHRRDFAPPSARIGPQAVPRVRSP